MKIKFFKINSSNSFYKNTIDKTTNVSSERELIFKEILLVSHLSFDGNFLSFSLVQGLPRDLQIIAYKYDSAHAHNRLAEFSYKKIKYDATHA